MRRRPPISTPLYSSAASDVYKRQAGKGPSLQAPVAAPEFAREYAHPTGPVEHSEDRIEQAGRPWNLDLNTVLALKAVLVLAVLGGLLLLGSLRVLPGLWFLGLVVLALPGGYYLPDLMLL